MSSFSIKKRLIHGFLIVLVVSTGSAFLGCTSRLDPSKDPRKSLTDYISQSFSVKNVEDRPKLLDFLTGDVKLRLAGWSDDQFREAFLESKREFLKLSFKEVKDVSPTEVQITYELAYMDRGHGRYGQKHEAKVTNKKLCQLVFDHGKWLISDVRNIKELVEYKNEMSLP